MYGSNYIDCGAAWLRGQLQRHASRVVQYTRHGVWGGPIVATPYMQSHEALDSESGVVTSLLSFDFNISAAALAAIGSPRPGDRITETINGQAYVYEVTPLPDGDCWHRWDSSGLMLVVHTQLVGG